MQQALELARKGWGKTHPNPMVGAVLVENGEKVAEGYHQKAGEAHAEVAALQALGRKPKSDALLYVTLEPCSTHGKTGACTEAILESGLQTVVVGTRDPNPNHAGRGLQILREAGLDVVEGVLEEECSDLNLIFNHWVTHGKKPLVALKYATTLDGKMATASGDSKWITGEGARFDVARWRRYFPAIVVGADTILRDNPALTSRQELEPPWCPQRFVFDSQLRSFAKMPEASVYTDTFREKTTLVVSEKAEDSRKNQAREAGLEVWEFPENAAGRPDPAAFLKKVQAAGWVGIWIEGGSVLGNQFLKDDLIDYLFLYTAPKILGDARARPAFSFREVERMAEARTLIQPRFDQFGDDRLVRGYLKKDAL